MEELVEDCELSDVLESLLESEVCEDDDPPELSEFPVELLTELPWESCEEAALKLVLELTELAELPPDPPLSLEEIEESLEPCEDDVPAEELTDLSLEFEVLLEESWELAELLSPLEAVLESVEEEVLEDDDVLAALLVLSDELEDVEEVLFDEVAEESLLVAELTLLPPLELLEDTELEVEDSDDP
ncbi:MAG: hypothetical protein Q7R81_02560 [Candidatus Peregrinibacteria bacterium]|nr:hypothetical protein [Candidatus Peregrinibacteria bacterium]